MPPEQTPPQSAAPVPSFKSKRRHVPGGRWIVLALVLAVLAVILLPIFKGKTAKSGTIMELAQAKQIGLALKIFAEDHDGVFPRAGLPDMLGSEVKNSNAAFAVLLPEYLSNEKIFGNKRSAHQTREPDDEIDNPYTGKPVKTLEPGENVYAYVAGLTQKADPATPLVVDGTDGTGHYTTDPAKRGGAWAGQKSVVISVDNSGALVPLAGPDNARYIPRHEPNSKEDKGNLLDVSGLGADVRLLDPAVGSR